MEVKQHTRIASAIPRIASFGPIVTSPKNDAMEVELCLFGVGN